jgi:hypothetical protein
MPTEKRIRADYPVRELQNARLWTARKDYECGWRRVQECCDIAAGETYIRISETRLPVCLMCAPPVAIDDVVSITKERKP